MDDALTALARRAGRGDRDALDAFLADAYPRVHRLCVALVGPADGPDVAQEALMRAVRALPEFHGNAPAGAWLARIARNACIDEGRGRARRQARVAQLGPASPVAAVDDAVLLRRLVDSLDADRRDALLLTRWAGLSYAEAADVLGVPIGTVRSRVARARGDLAQLLGAGAGDGSAHAGDRAG